MSIAYWRMYEHEADRKSLLRGTVSPIELREAIKPPLITRLTQVALITCWTQENAS